MTPLASHEKLFVLTDFIDSDTNHGAIPCQDCHGGDPDDPDWKTAHTGIIRDPSYAAPEKACGKCHPEESEGYTKSLHYTLAPYYTMIGKRANTAADVRSKVLAETKTYCGKCHGSCGQCHISRPASVEGGLLDGHLFQKSPPNDLTCTACHGTRIGDEYSGKHEKLLPDIHFEKFMKCEKCHPGSEMHGDGKEYGSRYAVENGPECKDCHSEIYAAGTENAETHTTHRDKVSCQVCHSQEYKNCYNCHVVEQKDGSRSFTSSPSTIGFKIGLNPNKSEKHPETFVTVRHIPVDKDLFKAFVKKGLTNLSSLPTWKMTTPHNIRRKTPQNESCNHCHGVESLYLLDKDVVKEEKKANKAVIVPTSSIPKRIE